jgi:hypothetical protein
MKTLVITHIKAIGLKMNRMGQIYGYKQTEKYTQSFGCKTHREKNSGAKEGNGGLAGRRGK